MNFVADWTGQVELELLCAASSSRLCPASRRTSPRHKPNGKRGWYNSDVTLTYTGLTAGLWNGQYSLDGGRTWTTGTAIAADHNGLVRYRAIDNAGVPSREKTLRLRLDKTAPTVAVTGIEDGATYGDSATLRPRWTATDATSRIDKVDARLDGKKIRSGNPIDLSALPLGSHQLTVTATDNAGNASTTSISFTTITSFADLQSIIDWRRRTGDIRPSTARQLTETLQKARAAADSGQTSTAITHLDAFVRQARNVDDRDTRVLLTRDARALITQVSG